MVDIIYEIISYIYNIPDKKGNAYTDISHLVSLFFGSSCFINKSMCFLFLSGTVDTLVFFSAGSKHGKKRSQHDLTMDNTMKDTERIELEKEKLAKEIEVLKVKRAKLIVETAKLKSERSTFEMKKLYYQFKIQQEFGITISDP